MLNMVLIAQAIGSCRYPASRLRGEAERQLGDRLPEVPDESGFSD